MKKQIKNIIMPFLIILLVILSMMATGCQQIQSEVSDETIKPSLTPTTGSSTVATEVQPVSTSTVAQPSADDAFLDEIQERAVDYFWQEADPQTGLIKDRAGNFKPDDYTVSSIAAVGFGLPALAIGESRGWISHEDAYQRTLSTLRFLHDEMPHEHGFYYHFVDMHTGERVWDSEVSSIDTALLLAGVIFAGEYFKGSEVECLANQLYRRVDFQWMLTDGGQRPNELFLSHGWTPENGFLPYRWGSYDEAMLLYLLSIGSPTKEYAISSESWDAWGRPEGTYAGYTTFAQGPLFTHQFSHAWVDFRNRPDRLGYDYFQSSINATLANRQFCIDQSVRYETYDEHVWGLSASDGPDGYKGYGALPGTPVHDGTVAPAAAAGSIVFTPELSLAALRTMHERYGDRIWGRYGFSDAFNVDRDWWDEDVIGIDLGITLLMIENYRSGLVWRTFEQHEAVQKALEAVGIEPKSQNKPQP